MRAENKKKEDTPHLQIYLGKNRLPHFAAACLFVLLLPIPEPALIPILTIATLPARIRKEDFFFDAVIDGFA